MVYDFNANLYKDSIIFLITNKTEGKGSRFLRSLRSVEMIGKRRLTVTMRAVFVIPSGGAAAAEGSDGKIG